jgi:hypothetical protein
MSTFSKLVGLYWYCNNHHTGQWSWQYKFLSESSYKPGRMTSNIEDEDDYEAQLYYDKLVAKFEQQ